MNYPAETSALLAVGQQRLLQTAAFVRGCAVTAYNFPPLIQRQCLITASCQNYKISAKKDIKNRRIVTGFTVTIEA